MKLLVVGWDAATNSHLEEFSVPFWESLEYNGLLLPEPLFHGTYISTGNAWTTMTTGAPFEDHHIFGFVHGPYVGHPLAQSIKTVIMQQWLPLPVRRVLLGFVLGNLATEGGRGGTPQSTDVPFKRVWEFLSGDALVFGLPVSYPTWSTNGIMVTGIPAPSPDEASHPLVSPPAIQPEVFDDAYSGYYVDMTSPIHDSSVSERAFCKAHEDKTDNITDRYIDLYQSHKNDQDFEFGFLMLRSIDDVLHATRKKRLAERIYQKTDEATERVVDAIDPDAVLVLSDHGMRPTSKLRIEKDIQMDHDTTQGVWGSTEPFNLQRHIDVTPQILNYLGVDADPPEKREGYKLTRERIDETAVHERLADLGYR